ncbi:lipopolysaccharide biosynthesis protein [Labilibaculum euxinus]
MIKKILSNKELLLVSASQIVQILGTILFTKILTVYLTKESYGYYSLAMSLVAVVTLLPFSAFNEGIGRFLSIYKEKGLLSNMLSNVGVIYSLFYIPYIVISLIAYSFIDENWRKVLIVLNLFVFFEILKRATRKIENNDRNRRFVAKSTLLEFFIKILLISLVAFYSSLSINLIFVVLFISNFLVVAWSVTERKNNYRINLINKNSCLSVFNKLSSFSWPLLVWSIFGWFLNMANRWLIDLFLTKENVAEYSLISSISLLPSTTITGILGVFLLPIIYQRANTDIMYPWIIIKKTVFFQIVFYLSLIVFFIYLGPLVITVLASEKYINSSWMFPNLIIGSGFFAIGQVLTYEIFALKETRRLLVSTILPGIWSVVGGYFLIKYYGVYGAVINFVTTYGLYLILTLITVVNYHFKILPKKANKELTLE